MPRRPKSDDYEYVLTWIREAVEARAAQTEFVDRSIKAYQGKPLRNFYVETAKAYANAVSKEDPVKGAILSKQAEEIPNKGSMVLHNAVETIVSSTMGGVGRFEFAPYDPDQELDDKTADLLGSAAKHFWHIEGMDSLTPQAIRAAVLAGEAWFHLKQRGSDGCKQVTLLETSQMLTDPKRFKTNKQRFIGFEQVESFDVLKKHLTKKKDGTVLSTLNKAEVYMSGLKQQVNSVDGVNRVIDDAERSSISADLDIFYKDIVQRTQTMRKKDKDYTWDGDDVHVAYLYDLVSKRDYIVVNRRYVVGGQKTNLSRTIEYKGHEYDQDSGEMKEVDKSVTISIDHPFVNLPYMKTYWDKYSISPLFYVLDDFDSLCAMESVFYHNLSIMAPITFIGQSSDGELVSRVASVAGEIVDGLPQTFTTLGKAHDLGPITLAIQKYEDKIKRVLKATDPMEMQAMIGDRASAKEAVGMLGQVSQGLNPLVANIETAMAELGQKFIKLEIIYGNKDAINFVHNGAYGELAAEEAAGTWDVTARMASSVKLEQESNARRALELIQYLAGAEFVDKREFIGTLVPIVLNSLVNREKAEAMVGKDYKPMEEELVAKLKERAEAEANKHPIDKLDLNSLSEEELDALITEISQDTDDFGDGTVPLDENGNPINPQDQIAMEQAIQDEMAMQQSQDYDPNAVVDTGAPQTDPSQQLQLTGMPGSEEAGIVANDPTGGMYVE